MEQHEHVNSEDVDEPSAQLQLDLRAAVTEALGSRRPLLHHLNADSSWLLQIPRPVVASRRGGRFYFNILVDPWLAGGQSDVAKWFSQQFHATESKVGSIAAVEQLLHEIETLASALRDDDKRASEWQDDTENRHAGSFIDAVAISHEFTDHCHKDTLLQVHPDVPIFATDKAAPLIQSWSHFRQVLTTPHFKSDNPDWHSTAVPPLPEWIGISRLVTKGDALYYHSALLVAFNNRSIPPTAHGRANGSSARYANNELETKRIQSSRIASTPREDEDSAEAVIYTPHGIQDEDLALIPAASPPIQTLAFLHGLHDITIGSQQQLNLGAHNGLKAQRLLNAKYWISTHDEEKTGGGLVSWFLRRKVISLKDALEEERKGKENFESNDSKNDLHDHDLTSFDGTNWIGLSNGESRVLL